MHFMRRLDIDALIDAVNDSDVIAEWGALAGGGSEADIEADLFQKGVKVIRHIIRQMAREAAEDGEQDAVEELIELHRFLNGLDDHNQVH